MSAVTRVKCSFCREDHPTEHTVDGPNGLAICCTFLHACADILLDRGNPLQTELRKVSSALASADQVFSLRDPLIANITRCHNGVPLIVLEGRPFNGLEIRSLQLERMSGLLLQIAHMGKRHSGKNDVRVVLS